MSDVTGTGEPAAPSERTVAELRLALDNRIAALAELHERVRTLELDLVEARREADGTRRPDDVEREEREQLERQQLEERVEHLSHQLRVTQHELGDLEYRSSVRQWEQDQELHRLRVELAEATTRANAAEEQPLRHFLSRLKRRVGG